VTTTEIAGYANEEGHIIGASDMNLQVRLRRKVIPMFYLDVGQCGWRNLIATIAVTANTRQYDLPIDFVKMQDAPIYAIGEDTYSLAYIGENTREVALAEANTTLENPAGYWITRNGANPNAYRAIRLSRLPETNFTLVYPYLSAVRFADNATEIELDNYIPPEYQWALVEGLKKEIFANRIAVDDPRVVTASNEYDKFIERAQENRESAPRDAFKKITFGRM
jgi:hypothetical protein